MRHEPSVPVARRSLGHQSPQGELRSVIEATMEPMEGMILGEALKFEWVLEQIQYAEAAINGIGLKGGFGEFNTTPE